MGNLDNKTAFITGGAQGIGKGIVLALAKAGADIIIADLNADKAEAVVAEIKALGREGIAVRFDVTDENSIKNGVNAALNHFSRIHILVNNAGVFQKRKETEIETTLEDFDLCYDVNLKGVWRVINALIPHFKTHHDGKIVNIASVAGRKGSAKFPAYNASKAAVINLTQSLACALGPHNINVNAICPGVIWTPMLEEVEGILGHTDNKDKINAKVHFRNVYEQHTPLRRPQTPEDIGQAVTFLASSQAKNITGQALNVDGGLLMN